MSDRIYYLRTSEEHGRSDGRLRLAAARDAGLDVNAAELIVARTAEGKPYFPQSGLHCSVTHSGGIWLCAISALPVGVDLQRHQECDRNRIAKRFFHPDEARWLETREDAFFDVWCAKESYVKYTGEGMVCGLDGFSAVTGDGMAGRIGGAELRRVDFSPDFVLYVCGGSGETVLKELPGGDIPVSNDDIGG